VTSDVISFMSEEEDTWEKFIKKWEDLRCRPTRPSTERMILTMKCMNRLVFFSEILIKWMKEKSFPI